MIGKETDPIRPSIVSVMGHVDHGKTTLLDALSNWNVAQHEPGKITQSISAFSINLSETNTYSLTNNRTRVTFLDTPGHESFVNMRESSALVADFSILVISALDGLQKQTLESLNIIKASHIPAIIAINKIDVASEEQIKNVYKQLVENNLLSPSITHENNAAMNLNFDKLINEVDERYPIVAVVEISALKGHNMNILRDTIEQLHISMSDFLHCSLDVPAEATVIESISSQEMGKQLLLITHLGTLNKGDHFVVDQYIGTIRSLQIADMRHLSLDKTAKKRTSTLHQTPIFSPTVDSVGPGMPVLVSGLQAPKFPVPGASLFQLSREEAHRVAEYRSLLMEYKIKEIMGLLYKSPPEEVAEEEMEEGDQGPDEFVGGEVEDVEEDIEEEVKRNISVIIKADNQGRLDAILKAATDTAKSMDFELKIVSQGVGSLNPNDLFMAKLELEENKVARIPVFCFQVGVDSKGKDWMRSNVLSKKLFVLQHNVFTEMLEDVKEEIKMKMLRIEDRTKKENVNK